MEDYDKPWNKKLSRCFFERLLEKQQNSIKLIEETQ